MANIRRFPPPSTEQPNRPGMGGIPKSSHDGKKGPIRFSNHSKSKNQASCPYLSTLKGFGTKPFLKRQYLEDALMIESAIDSPSLPPIRPAEPDEQLNNWEIVPVPVKREFR